MKNTKSNQIATHIGNDICAFGAQSGLSEPHRRPPHFSIVQNDGVDDGAYYPAQSILIYGEDAVRQLRDFCDEILAVAKPDQQT